MGPSPLKNNDETRKEILSAIRDFVPSLNPNNPIFASFHNGQVQNPLGGGSYAFQDDIVGPVLSALVDDEVLEGKRSAAQPRLPTRPIVIHAGLQPNNSPHAGTLVVFCYAFSFARWMCGRMQKMAKDAGFGGKLPAVSVEITFVDTAPVDGKGVTVDGVQYQRAYRLAGPSDFTDDYHAVLRFLSRWSGIPYTAAFQSDFFSGPSIPKILEYILSRHITLGRQLSPKHGVLALRAACPVSGCGLAEKHGLLNTYKGSTITFKCPNHGPHSICVSEPAEAARIEANAPARNLIRSMSHLLDAKAHNVRVTGGDYAGTYQEMFLYRPLAAWSAATRLAVGKTPHILYAPVIVDWSGAKLSKSLYVREGAYDLMKVLGTDGLCSFARLRDHFDDDGSEGLRRIWLEVESWLKNPKKLFRSYSVEYLQRVIFETEKKD
ncbi:hypothetical protein B0T21DRAFT_295630 [Apiosordaria backusii]|uniref:Uncharacterized protein n=1 Tax=Apiosordaria backusii TaxID=314023 RepID=A0AA40AMV8_9PEZI|nr:hypothetical protein B0T21DRAFT_295630 [Apiosordaria backusii]